MGWFTASLLFVVAIICMAVLFPVAHALLPAISESMGGTVAMMVSSMLVVIIAVAIMVYIKQSQEPEDYFSDNY